MYVSEYYSPPWQEEGAYAPQDNTKEHHKEKQHISTTKETLTLPHPAHPAPANIAGAEFRAGGAAGRFFSRLVPIFPTLANKWVSVLLESRDTSTPPWYRVIPDAMISLHRKMSLHQTTTPSCRFCKGNLGSPVIPESRRNLVISDEPGDLRWWSEWGRLWGQVWDVIEGGFFF